VFFSGNIHPTNVFTGTILFAEAQMINSIPGFLTGKVFRRPCITAHEWTGSGSFDLQFTRQISLKCILPRRVQTLFHCTLRCSRWVVSFNCYYRTFAVTITVLSLNVSTVNICHCCKCWCVLRNQLSVLNFLVDRIWKNESFRILTSALLTSKLSFEWSGFSIN